MCHLFFTLSAPTRMYEDNAATIAVYNNERGTKRLRHVKLRHFAILGWVKNGDMILKKIFTSDNPSDEHTKHLDIFLHSHHSDTLLEK